jgi:glycosyltransferase involved in cell wall biosynthesis
MFRAGDPDALAAAVEILCADPAAAQRRAAEAARRLERLAWSHQRERYLNLVDSLAAAGTRR